MRSERYNEIKKHYSEAVAFYKMGIFYKVYDNDALILYYIMDYKINNGCVSFPREKLNRVIKKLEGNHISSLIITKNDIIRNNVDNNKYEEILIEAKNKYKKYENINFIKDKIKSLIEANSENQEKIEKFLSEI